MRISTWNVNGIRSAVRRGMLDWIFDHDHDIICLQEVKMPSDLFTGDWFAPFEGHWFDAIRAGYSGVATLVNPNLTVLSVEKGLGDPILDAEGRVLTLELEKLIVINVYAPHSHRKLLRLAEKLKFGELFLSHLRRIQSKGKSIVIAGDLNVALDDRDLTNARSNRVNAGFLPEERQWLSDVLGLGFVDAFRVFHENGGHYTWWSMRTGVRERNVGWRLDYILVQNSLVNCLEGCFHSPLILGSDHCPVTTDLNIQ
jgi:exodeoxyribonuclease III